jgi:hypothetical protein
MGMGRKQHVVDLSNEERRTLEWFMLTGEHKAIKHHTRTYSSEARRGSQITAVVGL